MLEKFDPKRPYNELSLLPPESVDLESKIILKKCVEGRTLLAGLKEAAHRIPNQSVLINTIPLLEAQKSSEIENIVTTSDKLFEYSDRVEEADPHTKETLYYRRALFQACEIAQQRPINTHLAEQICTTLRNQNTQVRKVPGTKLMNGLTQEVIYTPPEGESLLRDKLANWETFLHEKDSIDPLVRMAVLHYQFEAIHPFVDGNGRTGRILNILYLVQAGLLEIPVLYLSRFIIQHKEDYYRYLLAVTVQQKWETWILYMLQAIIETAAWTKQKIHDIEKLFETTKEKVQRELPKIYSHELVELIFIQPYCRTHNVVDAGIAKRQTASLYLKQLCQIGVLKEIQRGREKLYLHPNFMELLVE